MDAGFEWTATPPDELAGQFDDLDAALASELEAAMEDATIRVMTDAARYAPVLTSDLRASIEQEIERVGEHVVRGLIGSDVEYAPIQEIEQPYLRPAIEDNLPYIEDRFERAVRDAIDEVR